MTDATGAYTTGTAQYYARRALQYDRIYEKPERQSDLATLRTVVAEFCSELNLLEVACGTGYWTVPAATTARAVCATDINEEVLELARRRDYCGAQVSFERMDLYAETAPGQDSDGGLAAHWYSHVAVDELPRFFGALHRQLLPGACVMLLDNRYVTGSSTPVSRTDEQGNTYQHRRLDDGSGYEVLKNFPDAERMARALDGYASDVSFVELDYYWYVQYRVLDE
jgi:SAM-dependent methyltransferase